MLTEIHKVKMGLSPPIMSDIFSLRENSSYNLRPGVTVNRRNIRTRKFGKRNDIKRYTNIRSIAWVKEIAIATSCLLDYPYFKPPRYKLIAIDLSKQQAPGADSKLINFRKSRTR